MDRASGEDSQHRWKWPQFSLMELLLTATILAGLWGALALREETDELVGSVVGSLVVVWCLVCWRTVRLNWRVVTMRRRTAADGGEQPRDPLPPDHASHDG